MSVIEIIIYVLLGSIMVFVLLKWTILDPRKKKKQNEQKENKRQIEENEDE